MAVRVSAELPVADQLAVLVGHCRVVGVLVGVDAADDSAGRS